MITQKFRDFYLCIIFASFFFSSISFSDPFTEDRIRQNETLINNTLDKQAKAELFYEQSFLYNALAYEDSFDIFDSLKNIENKKKSLSSMRNALRLYDHDVKSARIASIWLNSLHKIFNVERDSMITDAQIILTELSDTLHAVNYLVLLNTWGSLKEFDSALVYAKKASAIDAKYQKYITLYEELIQFKK
jgi:hypothetical protein